MLLSWAIIAGFLHLFSAQQLPYTYPNYTDHECKRTCDGEVKICYYQLAAEYMYSNVPNCLNCMNGTISDCDNPECIVADGRSRMMVTLNRMYPGPSIEVCLGDEIMVDLSNYMEDTVITLHWHGIHVSKTPWMDGVAMITQCPVNPISTFRYHIQTERPGSYFYHAHSGILRIDGFFGKLIIRQPLDDDVHKDLYDYDLYEHEISLNDWYVKPPRQHFWWNLRQKAFDYHMTAATLIDGRGSTDENKVPPRVYKVEQGKRYRFRMVHAGGEGCPMEVSIESHDLMIISTDGEDIQPIVAQRLFLINGERYDLILNADQPIQTYYMRVASHGICNKTAYALIEYHGAQKRSTEYKKAIFPDENSMSINCHSEFQNSKCKTPLDYVSTEPIPKELTGTPDFKHYLAFDNYFHALEQYRGARDNFITAGMINNISNQFPPFPLIHNPNHPKNRLCNIDDMDKSWCDDEGYCECTHYLKIPVDSVVEFIFVNEAHNVSNAHPFHIHGYYGYIIGYERIADKATLAEIRKRDANGLLIRNFNNPPRKDSFDVPGGGYAIVRFKASNLGIWAVHCHIDFHSEEGMMLAFQVGEVEEFGTPRDFPTCGSYTPNIII